MSWKSLATFAIAILVACPAGLAERFKVHQVDRSRKMEIVNKSGKKLVVDWINPVTGQSITMSGELSNGAKQVLDTYVNHTFAVHEPVSSPSCGSLDDDDCGVQYITVKDDDEQVAIVKEGMEIDHKDARTRAQERARSLTEHCRHVAHEDLRADFDPDDIFDELVDCLQESSSKLIQALNEEIAFENKIRLQISAEMENHTCSDPLRETSEPLEIRSWTHEDKPGLQVERNVYVLHDRPSSQIHAVKNFISAEECDAIADAAAPKLHRGTVADGSGGSKLSDSRKAWQAGVRVPWEKEEDGDLIAKVFRRIYAYSNDAVGYNITVHGQEDLMSIQYFGIGKSSTQAPDQYRPHCDGDCDGLPHKAGGRVATMVMYCDVPELGGGTNFQNANVFVKPEVGTAAFFSYLNAETMEKEAGFTSHSGCPVIEGTKRIAVHWMRHGVDSDNPWDSFNTLTVKRGEEDC